MNQTLGMPSAILFDLDDTILTCEEGDYRKLWRKVIDEFIHHFDEVSADEFYERLRSIADEFWSDQDRHRQGRRDIRATRARLVVEAARSLGQVNEEAAIQLAHEYHNRRENAVIPFDGALETLECLMSLPIKTALLTNGAAELQRRKIDRYALSKYFDVVLVEGEVGIGKPDPAIYLQAIKLLDVSAADTWIVGDNLEWEVRVPQELGITAIWHDFRGEGLPSAGDINPDRIVSRIREVLDLLPETTDKDPGKVGTLTT